MSQKEVEHLSVIKYCRSAGREEQKVIIWEVHYLELNAIRSSWAELIPVSFGARSSIIIWWLEDAYVWAAATLLCSSAYLTTYTWVWENPEIIVEVIPHIKTIKKKRHVNLWPKILGFTSKISYFGKRVLVLERFFELQ